ncbi:hypothetical protein [Candidatus Viridilinea mediisalina]|uniref:Uncharacterized protein n=1 Tax=Candidatus Viridilinea mediisalina TaxID=2024553 RepID=A0A2A6RGF5_9CHLR|nr:hypothetical protein [Candidatus Viridilinea mediisalina]PDW01940.1 hypothetical protein CJ255_16490 [Candidatus Viridilinea mediisalina]
MFPEEEAPMTMPPADFDGAWKYALEHYFPPFVAFFFPQTAGMFKDDPFANEFDAVMAAYRRECDHEDIPPTTQDHAA